MGNRAVITTEQLKGSLGLYVHWNGGKDSILGVLEFIKNNQDNEEYENILNNSRNEYELLKNVEIIYDIAFNQKNGINSYNSLDLKNGDNGVYIIDKEFNIIKREFMEDNEQTGYELSDILQYIKDKLDEYIFLKEYKLLDLIKLLDDNLSSWKVDKGKLYIEYELYDIRNPNLRRQIKTYSKVFDFINKENDLKYSRSGDRENCLVKLVDKEDFKNIGD